MKIHAITWSDHAPVTITMREQNSCNPTYLWRNNVSILSTPLHQEQLSKSLKEYFQHNDNTEVNVMSLWCAHKAYSRGFLIQAAAREKRQKTKILTNLLTNLNTLETHNKQSPSPITQSALIECRQKLRLALIAGHTTSRKCFKATYYAHGNKTGKLLANYIWKKQQNSKLSSITDPHTGQTVYHPTKIANAFQKYYSDLYNLKSDLKTPQPNNLNINTFLNSVTVPKLSEEALDSLNTPISEKEILDTIKSLPAYKSPGSDGFSAEYY